ncbi:unnamed protein product [Rhizoctonia solani]|uniref:XLF-like N-terminal domain-containing protein n=1 Tax=Rhizoctonia solani TaxID=456999 RepID=A0A8H3DDH0_9AGAM|nr:unnamed protein product [Rhizoctonia solani]
MEISDDQLTRLKRCPWLPGVHPESKLGFLMKFYADPEKEECYILVTDTVKVWAEAVQGRHISHRSPLAPHPRTEKQERRFIREILQLIHAAHQLCRIGDMEIVAEEGGKCADLLLTITTPTLHWEWRTFALHPSHASQVLSKHLILPMLTHMSISTLFGAGFDLETFTRQLDKTSKTARITMHTHLRAVFSKPIVACGLVRIAQIWEHVGEEFLHPVVEDLEELEPNTAPLYFPEPISDDDELEPQSEPEPYLGSGSIRSSPAPLPDADESATEDEDNEDDDAGETQLQTQIDGSAIGVGSRSQGLQAQASKYGQSQVSVYGGQSQVSAYGGQPPSSKHGSKSQSQSRPSIHPARSQPHPSRSKAQLSMMSVSGGRSISQPQVAGQKRPMDGSDSGSDEYERAEELLRRMNGATSSGSIGMKKKVVGRRKF